MATPKFNSKSPNIRRILREAQELSASPSPDYTATPIESDLFEWHFTLKGPPDSVYAEGIYHGRIVLPPTYPLRPPSFRFITPSGRFEANREICLSISGHHEETWQPAWGVRTALVALRSFMETDPKGQLGGLETTDAVRRRLATESRTFKCAVCAKSNSDIIAEAEAASKDVEGQAAEVVVPDELKMGWRDEMAQAEGAAGSGGDAAPAAPASAPAAVPGRDSETAALAEGFVPTTAPAPPQPTRTIPLPPAQQHHQVAQLVQYSDDGVLAWLDRAIVIVGFLLVAMFLKLLVA
ncbi:hypothetical protein PpBr36_07031 [Pyricularia pennisetigena]|uniref:hypothetical protein n=1 Tax=Pyricularia pennisetigena TaxID=1578925 RepID=UPI00114E6AFE|nr:hypothetical protein PpBr36_07031 [Pyricularia pennisetigena]TLS25133.1 hypothetical protein PpBr36_07031 [Pyricularia pennisetigena]